MESPILIDYQVNPERETYYYLVKIICLCGVAGGGIVIDHIQAGKKNKQTDAAVALAALDCTNAVLRNNFFWEKKTSTRE